MAIISPKRAKEDKTETMTRSWTAKPILSSEFTNDPPLEDIYVGLLRQKKDISTAIQTISSILPGLSHLKRCSSNKLLLAPLKSLDLLAKSEESSSEERTLTQDELKAVLKNREFDLTLLEDDFQIIKIPSIPAKTKAQAALASKIWPLNFHPDPNIERLIDGSIFTEHQLEQIERYMKVAVEAARLEAIGTKNCNGSAVIVDPEDGRILAISASRINQHPMWHAAMLAVDLVAKLQGGGAWKRNNVSKTIYLEESEKTGEDIEKCGPYLCTGYWTFLLREPCPLCAMALVHSRVSRIFYGVSNEYTGILGSRAVLHAVPGLNHRYQVWSDVLEEECRQAFDEIQHRNVD
ncbi:tRNA-specific adenosine deaminase-like protein 3 [Dufourea novaeangliae]|uniref:tRNA-specific adenosine deaminase-like protein 3 n=1 Tax=Dufourea novaeangliae TaxID=178035 RepID=A0A154P707_DUFNO|nr:tRNA-specific adenosine deaminase-like protein 3 [Dufourea novaeangliae]